jgi:hypothetical protein
MTTLLHSSPDDDPNQPRNISIGLKKLNVSDVRLCHSSRRTERSLGPVEYFRGKRFWLFAKQDDNGVNVEPVSVNNGKQSSLAQGLWRSGIVGRRR